MEPKHHKLLCYYRLLLYGELHNLIVVRKGRHDKFFRVMLQGTLSTANHTVLDSAGLTVSGCCCQASIYRRGTYGTATQSMIFQAVRWHRCSSRWHLGDMTDNVCSRTEVEVSNVPRELNIPLPCSILAAPSSHQTPRVCWGDEKAEANAPAQLMRQLQIRYEHCASRLLVNLVKLRDDCWLSGATQAQEPRNMEAWEDEEASVVLVRTSNSEV